MTADPEAGPVYIAADLVAALCSLAADREPNRVSVPLGVTRAGDLDLELPDEVPVLTHFYLPETARSVSDVFGMDLGTPSAASPGIFLAHPDADQSVSRRDELREVMIVAVPPWRPADVACFDRRGRRRRLEQLDIDVPTESPP